MQQSYDGLQQALAPLARQIERLEERLESRTRDLVTRNDLTELRKEVVTREYFQSELAALRTASARNATDIVGNKQEWEEQLEALKKEQVSRAERFWMRFGPLIMLAALILTFLEFITHFRFTP